ncbi:MAG: hypothetical protein WC587_03490 [Candidatus Paceibacterota bacterium]
MDLKNRIMLRVYAIWFFRKMTSLFALEIFSFVALFVYLAHCVSLGHIATNFYSSLRSINAASGFVLTAFNSTELLVKLTFIGMLTASVFMAKDLFKVVLRPTRTI